MSLATSFHNAPTAAKDYSKGAQKGVFTSADQAQVDENGMVLFGIDKELAARAALKKDTALEEQCKQFIAALAGMPLEGSLQEALKDGVALCNAANAIKPGICLKPSTSKMAFKQMENIANYSDACAKLGVPKISCFQTVALYENKDILAVVTNIQALGSVAQAQPGYSGPILGAKLAETNKREFTPEQLAKGAAEQTFLGKGSTGTAGAKLGAHIDYSKNIGKLDHVKGDIDGFGKNTEQTLMGKGSTDTEGSKMASHIDHSRNIGKMDHVVGDMDGLGFDGTTTALGNGSHGTAGSQMEVHIDRSKNIGKMDHVTGAEGYGVDGTVTLAGMGSHGTAGSKMGTHIDHSRNIGKMDHVVGDVENFGKGGEQTIMGTGSHGTAGSKMGTHIDTSKEINKMGQVVGADGFGMGGEQTIMGVGSHGQAGNKDAFQVDTSKDINKMAKVC